jgi:hypothetical protein
MTFQTSGKRFVPPKRRLFLFSLKQALLYPLLFAGFEIVTSKRDLIILAGLLLFIVVVSITIHYALPWQKTSEELEITISDQNICGMPEAPWFNSFRKLEKICIPLREIDKQKTRFEKVWYSSAHLVWSTNGKNILINGAFDEEQLREIAGLIGCPIEL